MKAIVCTKFGSADDLQFLEVEKPAPKDDEVLVEVHASSVNYNILVHVSGKPYMARLMGVGLLHPKIKVIGNDIAGRIIAVGRNVKRFLPGDEVFGDLFSYGFGAFAEYVCVPEEGLTLKPTNLSFREAASVPEAGLVALQGLRDQGQIQAGQQVLIYGASGGIGTFAVQIAKAFGAEVTGVCSTRNLGLVHSLGADHVIDYTQEDFTKKGQHYDLILAISGYHSIFEYQRALSSQGIYVMVGGAMKGPKAMAQIYEAMILAPMISKKGGKTMGGLTLKPNKDLSLMKDLIEAGKVSPVIDRCFPLNEAVGALRYYAEGHTRGKVVITVRDDN